MSHRKQQARGLALAVVDQTSPVFDGSKLLDLRLAKGMTLAALAGELKVSAAAVSKWERGRCSPEIDNALKLAEVLECKIESLFSAQPARPAA
jgi:transcriptional regulator with XRE-family HTH domain